MHTPNKTPSQSLRALARSTGLDGIAEGMARIADDVEHLEARLAIACASLQRLRVDAVNARLEACEAHFTRREETQRADAAVMMLGALTQEFERRQRAPRLVPVIIRHEVPRDVFEDFTRFNFLMHDHEDSETREKCRRLMSRLPTMTLSAARADIDGLMKDNPPPTPGRTMKAEPATA